LAAEREYELSEYDKGYYDPSSPLFHNYPSPGFEIRSILAQKQNTPEDILLTYVYELRDYRRVSFSQENSAKIADVIISSEVRDYFFTSH